MAVPAWVCAVHGLSFAIFPGRVRRGSWLSALLRLGFKV